MRNTATIVILSVVATVLVFGIAACITSKPFTAIGLAPILAAISLIIRAIRGRPTNPYGRFTQRRHARANMPAQPGQITKRPPQLSSRARIPSPTELPSEEITPQGLDPQHPPEVTPDGILAPPDITDVAQSIPPPAPTTNPRRGYRQHWPRPTQHRHR